MSDNNIQLSIVLPCYNPPVDWDKNIVIQYNSLSHLLGFLPELIIVNDGSSQLIEDTTVEYLQNQIPHLKFSGYDTNRGKGYALRCGVAEASGNIIIYTDIDFPYTNESLMSVWELLSAQKFDVAIGIKSKDYYRNVPKARVYISKLLRKIIGVCFSIPITDTQCGLKGFNQKGKSVFLSTTIDRYLFDLEFVYKSFKKKYVLKVISKEVELRPDITFRKMNPGILLSEGINFIKVLLSSK